MTTSNARPDFYAALTDLLPPGGTLLDLACGDGALLKAALAAGAGAAEGVEISQEGVLACVQAGLTVHHGDITDGLTTHSDRSFDCVSLIRSLELFEKPEPVLEEMLRVGRRVLLTFTNFGRLSLALRFLATGILPSNDPERLGGPPARLTLPHLKHYCAHVGIRVEQIQPVPKTLLSNLLVEWYAEEIAVVLSRPPKTGAQEPVQLPLKPHNPGGKKNE